MFELIFGSDLWRTARKIQLHVGSVKICRTGFVVSVHSRNFIAAEISFRCCVTCLCVDDFFGQVQSRMHCPKIF